MIAPLRLFASRRTLRRALSPGAPYLLLVLPDEHIDLAGDIRAQRRLVVEPHRMGAHRCQHPAAPCAALLTPDVQLHATGCLVDHTFHLWCSPRRYRIADPIGVAN